MKEKKKKEKEEREKEEKVSVSKNGVTFNFSCNLLFLKVSKI